MLLEKQLQEAVDSMAFGNVMGAYIMLVMMLVLLGSADYIQL